MEDNNKSKKYKPRSPSYPSIDLEAAIRKARILKEKGGAGDYYMAIDAAMKFLGYSPKSSAGLLILAALKKYALLEEKGTGKGREFRLSKLAQTILFYESSSSNIDEYRMAIKEAALNPPIYKELWDRYGNAPNDVIEPYLVLKRDGGTFTEAGANDCIELYKKTISFANLINLDSISGHSEDKNQRIKENEMETMPNSHKNEHQAFIPGAKDNTKQTINFPVKVSEKMTANLQIQYPMDENDLNDFLTALEALKPGILQKVLNKQHAEKTE